EDENPFVRGRAVWLLAQLGEKGAKSVRGLLDHDDEKIRATAYQALRRVDADMIPIAKKVAHDPSAQVRREVAVSLRDVPFEQSGEILLTLAESYDGEDRSYLE